MLSLPYIVFDKAAEFIMEFFQLFLCNRNFYTICSVQCKAVEFIYMFHIYDEALVKLLQNVLLSTISKLSL